MCYCCGLACAKVRGDCLLAIVSRGELRKGQLCDTAGTGDQSYLVAPSPGFCTAQLGSLCCHRGKGKLILIGANTMTL